MNELRYIVIVICLVAIMCLNISDHFMVERYHSQVLAAIYDNGCSSHKQMHIERLEKQRIDTYNLSSLEQTK